MKAEIDGKQCTGCGLCMEICPEVFKMSMGADNKKVYAQEVPDTVRDRCREAAYDCIFGAIEVVS